MHCNEHAKMQIQLSQSSNRIETVGIDLDVHLFLQVNDLGEVATIRKLISKKPILTTAHCHQTLRKTNVQSDQESSVMLKTVDYIALINTSHPLIKAQFEMAFQRAEDLLKERKNFRITVSTSVISTLIFYRVQWDGVRTPRKNLISSVSHPFA